MGFLKDRYFGLSGRLNRKRYIFRALELSLIAIIITIAFGYVFGWDVVMGKKSGAAAMAYNLLNGICKLVLFWAGVHLMTRRLHDFNRSGWWQLIFILPGILTTITVLMVGVGGIADLAGSHAGEVSFKWGLGLGAFTVVLTAISLIAQFYIWFKRGTVGPNDYGPDPLEVPPVVEGAAQEAEVKKPEVVEAEPDTSETKQEDA